MNLPIKKLFFVFLLPFTLLFTASFTKCAVFPTEEIPEKISILTYNVCNLFDDINNGTEYPDFNPAGGYWNTSYYLSKLESVADAVIISLPPDGPDIIAFQEIENLKVLRDLSSGYLKNMGYRYMAAAEKDNSAITTGILSRYPLSGIKNHAVSIENFKMLRNIHECRIVTPAGEFVIFNNHWKSKIGGAEQTEAARIASASVISARTKELLAENPEIDIIVLGDLNENADEYIRQNRKYMTALFPADEVPEYNPGILFLTSETDTSFWNKNETVFYSPWLTLPGQGSYIYRNTWESIDHFLLAETLFDGKNFDYLSFSVIDSPALFNRYGSLLVWNKNTLSGYSDHLPLLLVIEAKNQEKR